MDKLPPDIAAVAQLLAQVRARVLLEEARGQSQREDERPDALRATGPLLLKVEDVAKALSVGRSEVYKLIQSCALPSIKIGRLRRVSSEELRAWVRRRSNDPT